MKPFYDIATSEQDDYWRQINEYKAYFNARIVTFSVEYVLGEASGIIALENWFMSKFFKRELSDIKSATELIACPI